MAKAYSEVALEKVNNNAAKLAELPKEPWKGFWCRMLHANTPLPILEWAATLHNIQQKSSTGSKISELIEKVQQQAELRVNEAEKQKKDGKGTAKKDGKKQAPWFPGDDNVMNDLIQSSYEDSRVTPEEWQKLTTDKAYEKTV